ncbi:helix-turn-helix transcriptional regulator [Streptomyces prasinopilosus]|uniref:Two-component system, NarL family, nitrate/nitrite response regulator NarL n=1 Tax=Streptomyces prasinopilosus TaxID=67344 RepID=A0A1G6M2Y6_9ACTN|nr:response regulator transcription factor [Streptomyces prasinopilosus]SDC49830.1 two-component system, NarL family, nitrate/nitrite response regulator NarL [Streptomyces prasinopilosus]
MLLLIDNPVVAAGLESVLHQLPRVRKVFAATAATWSRAVDSGDFQALVVTLEQWELLGTRGAGDRQPLPAVLVLGDAPYDRYSELFVSLPVDGFLALSELTAPSLDDTLRRALSGGMPMPTTLARRLLSGSHTRTRVLGQGPHSVLLTPRETETLALLAKGMSNKQIARVLGISTHGAKRLVGSILLKLGSPNRTSAVITALKEGLV